MRLRIFVFTLTISNGTGGTSLLGEMDPAGVAERQPEISQTSRSRQRDWPFNTCAHLSDGVPLS